MNISKKPSRPKTAFGQVVSELGQRFFTHDVGRDSAALSYYFLFAIFPLLILISLLVGLLHVNIESTSALLSQVIPADVVGVIENYLSYVSGLRSPKMLWFCMIFSIWFPMRAINCLTHSIRKAFGHGNPDSPLKNQFFLFLAALVLILVISFSLSLIVIGRRVLEFAARFITLSEGFITVWNYGRFAVLFVIILKHFRHLFSRRGTADAVERRIARCSVFRCGVDTFQRHLFLLCGAFRKLQHSLRLHRHHRGGASVAFHDVHCFGFGCRAVCRFDTAAA